MFPRFQRFIRGAAVNWIGKAGIGLTTSSFISIVLLEIARLTGALTNAYIGLISYLLLPALFVIGLLLIPLGWRKYQKASGRSTRELLRERFDPTDVQASRLGARIFRIVAGLTLVNFLFMGTVSMQMLKFMDEPHFCGTACHKVMSPEWTTYQDSPHARVKCVECHVGEGAAALLDAKLNGVWQIISASLKLYHQPIPTPVVKLRPARETCEKCHWPSKFYGSRLKTIFSYAKDEHSTQRYTTLNLKVDAGSAERRAGIHWHIAPENEVRYASVADKREEMIFVEARQADGTFKRYTNPNLTPQIHDELPVRTMDCVDCHNRATHVYENPEKAVATRLRLGMFDRSLPYVYREGIVAITRNYNDLDAARKGIANHLRGFYERNYSDIAQQRSAAIDSAVAVLQRVYARNIHHGMKIIWGSYPNHIGHREGGGCFRCHNAKLVDAAGKHIAFDCANCHSILAYDSDEPFKFLQPAHTEDRDFRMHKYLQNEFLNSYVE